MNKIMACMVFCLSAACGSKTGLYDIRRVMPPDVPTCPDGTPLANDWDCDGIPNDQEGTGGTSGTGGVSGTGGSSGTSGTGGTGGTAGTSGTGGAGGMFDFCPETSPAWECGNGWAVCITQPISAIKPSHVIKGSGDAFYWYAANGKRYVFPNIKTYRSWYPVGDDCPIVRRVEDADLATIMIGGNVTIRPGVNMIKITADPKIYAVSRGGVLHWITNEPVAVELYGWNWATYVIDTPDAFFVNYTVGLPTYGLQDYDPVMEIGTTTTIDQDLGL